MKHLILIRHAESTEKVTGISDEKRDLTLNGVHQAALAGSFLRDKLNVDIIFSSSATRAHVTSTIIAEQLGLSDDDIVEERDLYQASVGTLFNFIRDTDQHQNIAIVGHNPTMSYFAEFITDSTVEEMKPACVLLMKVEIGNWKDLAKGTATILERYEAFAV
ncbi:MAG: histidine phosphatase family protein [Bacteroidota bacterium]